MAQNSKAATVLVYTEKELAAIEALKAAEAPMTLKDLGVASGTIVSIQNKAKKVEAGTLEVPAGVEVINVTSVEETYKRPTTATVNQYTFVRDAADEDKLSDGAKAMLAMIKDSTDPLTIKQMKEINPEIAKPAFATSLVKKGCIAASQVEVETYTDAKHKLFSIA